MSLRHSASVSFWPLGGAVASLLHLPTLPVSIFYVIHLLPQTVTPLYGDTLDTFKLLCTVFLHCEFSEKNSHFSFCFHFHLLFPTLFFLVPHFFALTFAWLFNVCFSPSVSPRPFFLFFPLPSKWARVRVVGGLFGNTRGDRLPVSRLSRWWLEAIRYQLSPPGFNT